MLLIGTQESREVKQLITSICPLRHAQWRGVFFCKLVALTFCISVMQSQTEHMSLVQEKKTSNGSGIASG